MGDKISVTGEILQTDSTSQIDRNMVNFSIKVKAGTGTAQYIYFIVIELRRVRELNEVRKKLFSKPGSESPKLFLSFWHHSEKL